MDGSFTKYWAEVVCCHFNQIALTDSLECEG